MRLKSFRIKNYKSIIDSGICKLSTNDNITVLAGQNESGKSSVLQALDDFQRGKLRKEAIRDFQVPFKLPVIECGYFFNEDDYFLQNLFSDLKGELGKEFDPEFQKKILKAFVESEEVIIKREFLKNESYLLFADNFRALLLDEFEKNYYLSADSQKDSVKEGIENDINEVPSQERKTQEAEEEEESEEDEKELGFEGIIDTIAFLFFEYSPKIIFFDDFCDLLPDSISISDLKNKSENAKGYKAVRNCEAILGDDFVELEDLTDAACNSRQDGLNKEFTANFNEKWRQKIFKDNEVKVQVKYQQGGNNKAGPYLNFFISTKEGEYLTPGQRSQGLKWFLSFYLQLKAESNETVDLIILFDEPGLFLHSKAQSDIKRLFEELGEKDQIIYSTHSPYLIDINKLNRVRLAINTIDEGTKIEKITTKLVGRQLDALKPVTDALGLDLAHGFSPVNKQNVVLEGIADFNYFLAMKKLLAINDEYSFVPSMGASNMHLLMELCIGWGLDWVLIFDDEAGSKTAMRKIKDSFFDGKEEELKEKAYVLKDCKGIEDMFTLKDLRLINGDFQIPGNQSRSEIIKKEFGGKELFSRFFLEKVNCEEITIDKISPTTIAKFEKVFKFIDSKLLGNAP